MLIEGFLAFLPHPGKSRDPSAEVVSDFAVAKGYEVIKFPYVLAAHSSPGSRPAPDRGSLLRAFPGSIRSPLAAEAAALTSDCNTVEAWARRKLQLFTLIHYDARSMQVTTDILGRMRFYWADVPGGLLLGSSIHDLLTCFPSLMQPADHLALAEFVGGSAPRQDRTLHKKIRGSLSGQIVSWDAEEGPSIREGRRLSVPEVDQRVTPDQAADRIISLLERSIRDTIADPNQVVIPLTGGFDSRLLACLCKDLGIEFEAITLGHGYHLEVRVAKAVARTLNIKHRVVSPRQEFKDRIGLWLDTTEGQVIAGTSFMGEMLNRGFTAGTTVLSGFLGDVLAAGALHWWGDNEPTRDPADTAEMIADYIFKGTHPHLEERLGLSCRRPDMVEEIQKGLLPTPQDHQAMLRWNLEHPRAIMQQLYYLGHEYHVGVPYYHHDLIQLWFSMPPSMFRDKRLLNLVFEKRWPRIAAIPHAERRPSRFPQSLAAAGYLFPWAVQDLGDRLQKRFLPPSKQLANRTNIWHMWGKMSREERSREIAFLKTHQDAVGKVLGWEFPLSGDAALWETIALSPGKANRALRGMYLITEYCCWIQETVLDRDP